MSDWDAHRYDRLSAGERETFVDALTEQARPNRPSYTLDYWRLTIAGRKPEVE